MATQLGELQISNIDDVTVHGYFVSRYEGNVYTPNKVWAARVLVEAWEMLGEPKDSFLGQLFRRVSFPPKSLEDRLVKHIISSSFDSPNQATTNFTIEVDEPGVLDGLGPLAWESYSLG